MSKKYTLLPVGFRFEFANKVLRTVCRLLGRAVLVNGTIVLAILELSPLPKFRLFLGLPPETNCRRRANVP